MGKCPEKCRYRYIVNPGGNRFVCTHRKVCKLVAPANTVQQLKAEIAAIANDLSTLASGAWDYGESDRVIALLRQLSAI